MTEPEQPFVNFEELHVCPICRKFFIEEKSLYKHILDAHQDQQYMSFDLHADLYERWQGRIPRCNQ